MAAPAGERTTRGPGTAEREPTVEVYDLVDGAYALQGKASGDDELFVTGPVPVRVSPAALLA